jgi:hypothetical protein
VRDACNIHADAVSYLEVTMSPTPAPSYSPVRPTVSPTTLMPSQSPSTVMPSQSPTTHEVRKLCLIFKLR